MIVSTKLDRMDHHALCGLFVPLVTPFTEQGQIAEEALEKLAHSVLDDGASGLVALGTTAETSTLSESERQWVLDVCANVCRERGAPLIAGAGGNDTRSSAEALQLVGKRSDVDAALVPVPYYTRPGEAGVVAHFSEVAERSPVPLIVYNIPYRTGQVLSVDALHRLARIDGVIGVKQALGGIDADTIDLLGDTPPGFAVLAGDDVVAPALLALGAAGGIIASSNLCAGDFAELVSAWRDGEVDRARTIGHRLARLSAAVFAEPNPTVIKGVLHAQGRIPSPAVRLPLLAAAEESVENALAHLEKGRHPRAHQRNG